MTAAKIDIGWQVERKYTARGFDRNTHTVNHNFHVDLLQELLVSDVRLSGGNTSEQRMGHIIVCTQRAVDKQHFELTSAEPSAGRAKRISSAIRYMSILFDLINQSRFIKK